MDTEESTKVAKKMALHEFELLFEWIELINAGISFGFCIRLRLFLDPQVLCSMLAS
jgi:hypothetical protein